MLRSVCLFVICLLLLMTPAVAETGHPVVFGPFRAQLPKRFALVPARTPGVLLLAHRENARFPSLNIIEISGPYDFARSKSEILTGLVSSYRQVGLAGVRPVFASIRDRAPFPLVTAHLTYEDGETIMHAHVFISAGIDSHYIATLLGPAAQEAELERLFSRLLLSLEHSNPPVVRDRSAAAGTPAGNNLFWITLAGAGILILLWLVVRKRQ